MDDYDSYEGDEVGQLKREVSDLQHWKSQDELKSTQRESSIRHRNLSKQVIDTDTKLEKEGYPGFSAMAGSVTNELQKLVNEDPENRYLDNPKGWEKVYKERVFPVMKKKFIPSKTDKKGEESKVEKIESEVETREGEQTEENEWGIGDYVKMRRDAQL